jgi:hypothetical protein
MARARAFLRILEEVGLMKCRRYDEKCRTYMNGNVVEDGIGDGVLCDVSGRKKVGRETGP